MFIFTLMSFNSVANTYSNLYRRFLFTIALITTFMQLSQTQLTWNNYLNIQSGHVAVYTGSNLINSYTPAVSVSRPYTVSSGGSVSAAIGVTLFQLPQSHDFCILTNKTITPTTLTLTVKILQQTVFFYLQLDYIVMTVNNPVFRMLSNIFYPKVMNDSVGYRSQYDVMLPSISPDPFFAVTSLEYILVLQGFSILNPMGSYTFLSGNVYIPSPGVINTTFFTYQCNKVKFIQYSIIFYRRSTAYQTMKLLFQTGVVSLTSNNALITNFVSGILPRYTSSAGRMFFGMMEFNFTYANNKYFSLQTSNFGNLMTQYVFTSQSIIRIKMAYYFFAERVCSGGQYFAKNYADSSLDTCAALCSGYSDQPTSNALNSMCLPCHYSCATCSTSSSSSQCMTCNGAVTQRTLSAAAPAFCNCNTNYVDIGSTVCVLCSTVMTGCLTCSSSVTCTSCLPSFTGATCTCSSGSIVSGYCNLDLGCTSISVINTTATCTACDKTLLLTLAANFTCICIAGTTTNPNQTCSRNCGDNYVLSVQGCDDGNLISGDGCSSTCLVETNWRCVGTFGQGSTCKIDVITNLQYVGVQRITYENAAKLYFSLTPYFPQFQKIDYFGLLYTNITYTDLQLDYYIEAGFLIATIDYTQDIQNTLQVFKLFLNNTRYFWYSSDFATILMNGVNCQLTYDTQLWMHNTLQYVYIILVAVAICVFITSIFFQKWIGLELIQAIQSVFYIFALLGQFPFQFSAIYEKIKYANGFDDVMPSDYYRTYTLSKQLNALSIQKQFLSNFNVLYILIIVSILSLAVIGVVKRRYRIMLQQQVSRDVTKKMKKADKVYSFVFGRIFLMLIFFSMFKIIFCFCVQLSNQHSIVQIFPDQLNIAAGIFAFIIVFSMISFVLYWYLLLPSNFTQDQQFMSLQFLNMKFFYPTIYLGYQVFFILAISITYSQNFTIYTTLILQILYLLFLIIAQPYNTLRQINKTIHNATIIFNQIFTIFISAVVIRWNSILGTSYQVQSNYQITVFAFLILFMMIIAIALAIVRLAMFNREVTCKCCRKEEVDIQELDYNSMKKMINQGKIKTSGNESVREKLAAGEEANQNQQKNKQNKKVKQEEDIQIDESKVDQYLNDKYINWTKQPIDSKDQKQASHIKRASNKKRAALVKSSLQIYLEMKKKHKEIEDSRFEDERFNH